MGKVIDWRSKARVGLIGRLLLVVAIVAFIFGAWAAWNSLDLGANSVNWWLLLVVGLIGAPASQFLNAAEYRIMSTSLGTTASWRSSFLVTVAGSAANQLPVPGSFLVRTVSLTSRGVSASRATIMASVTAVLFLGAASTGVAVAALNDRVALVMLVALVAAAVCFAGGTLLAVRACAVDLTSVGRLVIVEVGLVIVASLRAWGFATALDLPGSVVQFVGLSAGAALSTTIGVLPAGIGLTELLTGGLASLVGLGASVGLLIAILDRVFRMSFLAVASLALVLRGGAGLGNVDYPSG